MKNSVIAKTYAQAVVQIAKKQKEFSKAQEEAEQYTSELSSELLTKIS